MMSSEGCREEHLPASDYDQARSALFLEIFSRHGTASFQLYWSSFRLFIIGQLSKEEFDVVVLSVLSEDKGSTYRSDYSLPSCWITALLRTSCVYNLIYALLLSSVYLHNKLVMVALYRISSNSCVRSDLRSDLACDLLRDFPIKAKDPAEEPL